MNPMIALLVALCGQAVMIDERYLEQLKAAAAEAASAKDNAGGDRPRVIRSGAPASLAEGAVQGGGGTYTRVGSVGVVDVWGVLMKNPEDVRDAWGDRFGTSYQEIRAGVFAALADRDVKTVMLRIDSPGGAAIPVETAAAEIFAFANQAGETRAGQGAGKPIVAVIDGLGASAAYYIASQAGAIYATPGAFVGSIGTRMDLANFAGLLDKWGIKIETIKSTAAKDAGSPYRPMSEADRALLQAEVNAFDAQFVAAVSRGRGVDAATVKVWQGVRGYIGKDAQAKGLVDGTVNSVEALIGLLNSESSGRVVKGRRMGSSPSSVSSVGAVGNHGQTPAGSVPAGIAAGKPATEDGMNRFSGIAAIAAGALAGLNLDPGATVTGGGVPGGVPSGGGGGAPAPDALDRAKIASEARAAEQSRVRSIMAAAVPFAGNERITKLRDEAIASGETLDQFQAKALQNLAPAPAGPGPGNVGQGGTTPTPIGGISITEEQSTKFGSAAALGLVLRHCPGDVAALRGHESSDPRERRVASEIARHWGYSSASKALEAMNAARGDGLANLSLSQLALKCVATGLGLDLATAMSRFGDPQMLFRQAISMRSGGVVGAVGGIGSSDFSIIALNVAQKAMMASFAMKSVVWDRICRRGTATDFKTAYMVGMSELGKFVKTPEHAPISETRPVERKETIAVEKYTNGFSLSFETMVNDDLGAFLNIPRQLGEMAKYIPDDLLFTLLATDGLGPVMATDSEKLFSSAHNNIATGAALSYDSVRATRLLGRKQKSRGKDQVELNIDMPVLLVHTDNSNLAEDLAVQEYVPGTAGGQNQRNSLRGVIEPVWSNKVASSTRFYTFCRPGPESAIEVRFLFGQETPTVALSNLSDLTAQRYDAMVPGVGIAAGSWEGAATNAGA